MSYRDLLVQRATLEQATITRTATGEESEAWATKFSEVPVLVRFLSAQEDVPVGLAEEITHLIHMEPISQVASGRWRALIDGREYRFVDVRDPGHRGQHFEVFARRLA